MKNRDGFFLTYNINYSITVATAVSQAVSTGIYLAYIFRGKSIFNFSMKNFTPSKEILSEIFKVGVPTLVFQILTSLSLTWINTQAKGYGDSVIAAMGVAARVMSLGSLMVFGFLKGYQPIAGFSYGAGKSDRFRQAVRTADIWSTVFCAVFGLAAALCPEAVMSQFTKGDARMISVGAAALRANGISFILFGYCTVRTNTFLAMGKGFKGFILGACRQGICFVPAVLLLPALFGVEGIPYVQSAADVLSAVVTAAMSARWLERV